ncbi:MAG: hypothetical protein A4E45_01373 [Methanosaeta sp. PtaB.Bin039]|nr:MAG: hypothetical protein A4E45_01373 [Methanosaeta sp. PtaB.Bin039]HOT06249.1 hypothetical protein [Methanotrichaceae archaeon]HQF15441.1 hypothetical protein [Methanotrichaceae archaeon]HQI90176.1 hypothetical protein [Methanotrichaceae archaeon]
MNRICKIALILMVTSGVFSVMIVPGSAEDEASPAKQSEGDRPNVVSAELLQNPWILAEAILLLFLFASVPIIWNMHKYYNHVAIIEGILKEKVPAGDKDLVNIFAQCEMTGPSGFQGVGRVTLALTLCMIVGLGVLFLFANPDAESNSNSQYVKDILLALTGTISSIIGFYFGGRGSAGDFVLQDIKK